MNQRTIVRSLTTDEGTLVAMNDGLIVWKPIDGRPFRMHLEALPTVLLVVRGPMGNLDLAAIGTSSGTGQVVDLTTARTRHNLFSPRRQYTCPGLGE